MTVGRTVPAGPTGAGTSDRRRMFRLLLVPVVAGVAAPSSGAPPADAARPDGGALCAAIAARVDDVPGSAPVLLRSWGRRRRARPAGEPALATAAFTYDNALAAIALVACGRRAQALRIGEALLAAALADRSGTTGRLRNAYRAGVQAARPVPPMGWWDARRGRWPRTPTRSAAPPATSRGPRSRCRR
jgi:hypothetical protein